MEVGKGGVRQRRKLARAGGLPRLFAAMPGKLGQLGGGSAMCREGARGTGGLQAMATLLLKRVKPPIASPVPLWVQGGGLRALAKSPAGCLGSTAALALMDLTLGQGNGVAHPPACPGKRGERRSWGRADRELPSRLPAARTLCVSSLPSPPALPGFVPSLPWVSWGGENEGKAYLPLLPSGRGRKWLMDGAWEQAG